MSVENAYRLLYGAALAWLTALAGIMLFRSVRSAGVTGRLLCVNMIGTLVNGVILILAELLRESWLMDVALIYTMISFVSVLILVRVAAQAEDRDTETAGEGGKTDE